MGTPKKQGSKALTAVLIVLAVLLAAALVVTGLAFSDPYASKGIENTVPSDTLQKKFAQNAIARKDSSFSTDDVNSWLAYLFRKPDAKTGSGSVQLEDIAIVGASGDSADFYLPTLFHGKKLGVILNITPSLDAPSGKLLFRVNSAHVGRLPVPVGLVLDQAEKHLPERFTRSGNYITCDAPSVQASLLQVSATVRLSTFQLKNGVLKLSAETSVTVG